MSITVYVSTKWPVVGRSDVPPIGIKLNLFKSKSFVSLKYLPRYYLYKLVPLGTPFVPNYRKGTANLLVLDALPP